MSILLPNPFMSETAARGSASDPRPDRRTATHQAAPAPTARAQERPVEPLPAAPPPVKSDLELLSQLVRPLRK